MNKLAIFIDNQINKDNIEMVRQVAKEYIDLNYTTAVVSLNSYSALREKYDVDYVDPSFDYFITPQDDRDFSVDQLIVNAMVEIGCLPKNTLIILSEKIGANPIIELRLDLHKRGF